MPSCQSAVCRKRIRRPPSYRRSSGEASVGPRSDKTVDVSRHVRRQSACTRRHARVSLRDMSRTLLLLRHAKSSYPDGVDDHDRPLAERGVREAPLAGDWIRIHAPSVDAVLCSTATRTRQTLEHTGIEARVDFRDEIYDATPGTVLGAINGVDVERLHAAGDRARARHIEPGSRTGRARQRRRGRRRRSPRSTPPRRSRC